MSRMFAHPPVTDATTRSIRNRDSVTTAAALPQIGGGVGRTFGQRALHQSRRYRGLQPEPVACPRPGPHRAACSQRRGSGPGVCVGRWWVACNDPAASDHRAPKKLAARRPAPPRSSLAPQTAATPSRPRPRRPRRIRTKASLSRRRQRRIEPAARVSSRLDA